MLINELAIIGGIIFGSSGVTGFVTWLIRRGDRRTEDLRDMMVQVLKVQSLNVEAIMVSLICQKNGECNGEIDEMISKLGQAKAEREDYLTRQTVKRW
jgi:hypothetical protein